MNDKQKSWLLKIEAEIRQQFPGDPFETDEGVEALTSKMSEIYHKANENETVRRWMMAILDGYNDKHKILTGHGNTQAELLKEYAARLDRYKQEERRREEDDGK